MGFVLLLCISIGLVNSGYGYPEVYNAQDPQLSTNSLVSIVRYTGSVPTYYALLPRKSKIKATTTPSPLPPSEPTVSYLNINWFFNPSPNNPEKLWYHYAGSLAGLNRYAEVLTGEARDSKDADGLEDLCLYEIWLPVVSDNSANWTQLGFGKKLQRKCKTDAGKSVVNDCTLTTINNKRAAQFAKTLEHVTLTDNDTFAVYVQTWDDGLRDWNIVVPLNKKISKENKKAIKKHVREDLGFLDPEDIYKLEYSSCYFINSNNCK